MDARERLNDLLTATSSYREELAEEIMERVRQLSDQTSAMSEAASILRGRPVEERATPPPQDPAITVLLQQADEQLRELRQEVVRLNEEQVQPLSARLREERERAEEARVLAEERGAELQAALARIEELERVPEPAEPEPAPPPEPEPEPVPEPEPEPAPPEPEPEPEPTPTLAPEPGTAEVYGLARSPKPIAEMRSGEAEKEQRLIWLTQYLIDNHSWEPTNPSDLRDELGDQQGYSSHPGKVSQDLRLLEERGVIKRTGKLVLSNSVKVLRREGSMGGRPAVEYRLIEELRKDPDDVQNVVRDHFRDHPEDMASPQRVAAAVERPMGLVLPALEALVRRGALQDMSPSPDMRLFKYAGKPEASPEKAAPKVKDQSGRHSGGGVATGSGPRASNKDIRDLINAAERAGAKVKHEASGHFAVTVPGSGKRVLISSTPSNPRTVLNDRARLRKAGLRIA